MFKLSLHNAECIYPNGEYQSSILADRWTNLRSSEIANFNKYEHYKIENWVSEQIHQNVRVVLIQDGYRSDYSIEY